MKKNKYGLSRTIPLDIARQVRQRDGFGCVICGNALFQYEHLEPEYKNAKRHSVAGICLLCGGCHDRKTRGMLAVETVKAAVLRPKAREVGFSWGPLDVGTTWPEVVLGTFTSVETKILLKIRHEDVLSISPPELHGGPYRISAFLRDTVGRPTLEIVDNEWRSPCANWDVEIRGRRLLIRRATQHVVLALRAEPPSRIVIEQLNMIHRGIKISAREGRSTTVTTASGATFTTSGYQGVGCAVGTQVDRSSIKIGIGCRAGYMMNGVLQS